MRRMCCVCQRTERDGEWLPVPAQADDEPVTHGYCPECYALVMAEIRRTIAERMRMRQAGQLGGWGSSLGAEASCV